MIFASRKRFNEEVQKEVEKRRELDGIHDRMSKMEQGFYNVLDERVHNIWQALRDHRRALDERCNELEARLDKHFPEDKPKQTYQEVYVTGTGVPVGDAEA